MRILVAEDNAGMRELLRQYLSRWGYEVVTAADGGEAWRVLGSGDAPKLAILDWQMPVMDGVEVCHRVRKVPSAIPTYLILLTAHGGKPDDVVLGLDAGADDYMTKPFHPEELRARVQVGARVVDLQTRLANQISQLEAASARVRQLHGILPICSYCKKIRDDRNYWKDVESYISAHSEAEFSHGICPDCYEKIVIPELKKG